MVIPTLTDDEGERNPPAAESAGRKCERNVKTVGVGRQSLLGVIDAELGRGRYFRLLRSRPHAQT